MSGGLLSLSQWDAAERGWLIGWTIYGPTCRDFPGWYVARAWLIEQPCRRRLLPWPFGHPDEYGIATAFVACLADTLTDARAVVGPEFSRLERERDDDPVIIETWI